MLDTISSYLVKKFGLSIGVYWHDFRAELLSRYFKDTDVFVVGYPKSGNTWFGFILANLINYSLGLSIDLDLKNFTDLVPDINKEMFYLGKIRNNIVWKEKRFFLTHSPYCRMFSHKKVIYVVRDPRDVLVSYWHYRRLTNPRFSRTLDGYAKEWVEWPCDWGRHVEGWLDRDNVFILRYEDMREDAFYFVDKALSFLGLGSCEKLVEKAIKMSSFEKMRRKEEKRGIGSVCTGERSGERFIRKGVVGSWKEELDKDTVAILEKRYSGLMRRLGYL